MGRLNIPLLGALIAAAKKDHELCTHLAEVDAESRPEVNLKLDDALADLFAVAEISQRDPVNPGLDFGLGPFISETIKPLAKGLLASAILIKVQFFGLGVHSLFVA
jgi:hypothetical protein